MILLDLALRSLFSAVKASSKSDILVFSTMDLLLLILINGPDNHMLSFIINLIEIRHPSLTSIYVRKIITIIFVEVLFLSTEILLHCRLSYTISLFSSLSLLLSLQR